MSDREAVMEQFNVWYRTNCELSNTLNTRRQIEQAYYASRAQAIDECLQLHESIKVTPPDNDEWIDAIIDSREA